MPKTVFQNIDHEMQHLHLIKRIQFFENSYRVAMKIPASYDPLPFYLNMITLLNYHYHRITHFVRSMQRNTNGKRSGGQAILEVCKIYQNDIGQLHRQNLDLVMLYCHYIWPTNDFISKSGSRLRSRYQAAINDRAAKFLKKLEDQWHHDQGIDGNTSRIVNLLQVLKKHPRNSAQWRVSYRELIDQVYQRLCARLNLNQYKLKSRFLTTLYAYNRTEKKPDGQHKQDSDMSFLFESDAQQTFRHIHDVYLESADHLLGYHSRKEQEMDSEIRPVLKQQIKLFQRLRNVFVSLNIFKWTTVVVLCCLLILYFRKIDWDNRLYSNIAFNIRSFFQLDIQSQSTKQKKKFFKDKIKNKDILFPVERIKENVDYFIDNRIYLKGTEGYIYFAENILPGFFLHIADWHSDSSFQDEVLRAATLLDINVAQHLKNIATMYRLPVMHEMSLRDQIFEMRRIFVKNRIFPFIFIALDNDVPYLFIFSEEILTKFSLSKETIDLLKIDQSKYPEGHLTLPVTFLVKGERYPFKQQAGYFEGEFAVVFETLSPNVIWTVHHEVGHVVDHWRFKYEDKALPLNIEMNSVLFPLLWRSQNQDYVNQRLMYEAGKKDPNDMYAQATKGILNGFALYMAELEGKSFAKNEMVTNKFEPDKIEGIRKRIVSQSADEIRMIAYQMYQEPEKYLSSVEAGVYVSFESDGEEMIYGTPHAISKRGFVLGGTHWGRRNRSGPRFIRAGQSLGVSDISFSIASFLRNALSLLMLSRRDIIQATRAEALAAAIMVFVFFNAITWFVQWLAAPYRKRMFYGRSLNDLITKIYYRHPLTDGTNVGQELCEKHILKMVSDPTKARDKQLVQDIAAFKATVDEKKRFVFDLCLCLAPYNPEHSLIIHKLHDLLFFLPFLGPYIARSPWIWSVQCHFHGRERYNFLLEDLARSVSSQSDIKELRFELKRIIDEYAKTGRPQFDKFQPQQDSFTRTISDLVYKYLSKENYTYHMNFKFLIDHLPQFQEESQEFDRLDEYSPGDDIRRIDWKATARSVTLTPKVRKYNRPYGVKVGLVMDMRLIQKESFQHKWAQDIAKFINVYNTISAGSCLDRLIFIKGDGTIHEFRVSMIMSGNTFSITEKILAKIMELWKELSAQSFVFPLNGVQFYTDKENFQYMHFINLTDFGQQAKSDVQFHRISAKRLNIFAIGVRREERHNIDMIIGQENKLFYW